MRLDGRRAYREVLEARRDALNARGGETHVTTGVRRPRCAGCGIGSRSVSELDRHVALVEEFMRGFGYSPSPSDAHEFLVEQRGLTPAQAEDAVVAWESANERPEDGHPT
jgi:hypothetical protein